LHGRLATRDKGRSAARTGDYEHARPTHFAGYFHDHDGGRTAPRESRASGWRTFDEADELARSIQGAQLRITPKDRAPGAWALLPLALERGFVQFVDEPCAALTHA